jgi:enamine deaminase RidA (YjgF/YER057c/UK114 family)
VIKQADQSHQHNIKGQTMIDRLHTSARMSKIVKHNGVAYICGQVGAGDSVAEQTRDCLSRVEALLLEAGSDLQHMLQATIWLSDMSDFAEMNDVLDAWVQKRHAPARACGEAKLARDVLKVEIIVTAAIIDLSV